MESSKPPLALPGPGVVLSGRVFEVLPGQIRRPVRVRQVHVAVEVDSPLDPNRGGWAPVGDEGIYRVTGVPDGRFVKISSVDDGGNHEFCATNTIVRGDTVLDILLYLPGAAVATPVLSGRILATIDGKQVPVAGVDVYYSSRAYSPDVSEITDQDGRYSLCGIPPIPGHLYMICGNDITAYDRPVHIREDTVIDIDATEFFTCLSPLMQR